MLSPPEERAATAEKIKQLEQFKSGKITAEQLAASITQRRINWLKSNLENMLKKYEKLSIEEAAYNIIFLEHMRINPYLSKMRRISPSKIMIASYNFCPYLEACKQLKLDTRVICKEIGEPSLKEMVERIRPKIKFSRDYVSIRPYSQFCREFFELV